MYANKKTVLTAVSILGGGGFVFAIRNAFVYCKNQFANLESLYKTIIFISILVFILVVLVFFVKPILLTIIRWTKFEKIHERELDSSSNMNNKLHARKNLNNMSKNLFKELNDANIDTNKDIEKIEKIIDIKGK